MLLPPPFFSSSLISCAGRANAVAKMTVLQLQVSLPTEPFIPFSVCLLIFSFTFCYFTLEITLKKSLWSQPRVKMQELKEL